MNMSRIAQIFLNNNILLDKTNKSVMTINRFRTHYSTHYRSGAVKPKPDTIPFGIVGVFCAVIPGLFIGAAISKSVANFLEENDLFVPSDDENDED